MSTFITLNANLRLDPTDLTYKIPMSTDQGSAEDVLVAYLQHFHIQLGLKRMEAYAKAYKIGRKHIESEAFQMELIFFFFFKAKCCPIYYQIFVLFPTPHLPERSKHTHTHTHTLDIVVFMFAASHLQCRCSFCLQNLPKATCSARKDVQDVQIQCQHHVTKGGNEL